MKAICAVSHETELNIYFSARASADVNFPVLKSIKTYPASGSKTIQSCKVS